jgi:hypothetical protein
VKQFARCTNCRQWYVYSFTTTVEIFTSRHVPKTTVWCCRCIADAEHRSQYATAQNDNRALFSTPESSLATLTLTERGASSDFQRLVLEHGALMERAMHEDDAVLVPLIEDFMRRCHSSQTHIESPEHLQRLNGHLQYWEAFLKALNQSR